MHRLSLFLLLGLFVLGCAVVWPGLPLLRGLVWDANGPVAGARVRLKGTAEAAITGPDGSFHLLCRPGPSRRVTAGKEGYYIAGVPIPPSQLLLTLTSLPSQDHEEYRWIDPTPDSVDRLHCSACHGEIYEEWAASGHARSATGRRFLNLYDGTDWQGRPNVGWSLLRDQPDSSGVCNSCHVPTMPFDGESAFDVRKARDVAALGVHCDFCHKIRGVADGPLGLAHGRFNLKLLRPGARQVFLGPLDDVNTGDDAFSPLYRDSRSCAPCHEGTLLGVPVYTTYSEWLASPDRLQGKQCQTCHMARQGAWPTSHRARAVSSPTRPRWPITGSFQEHAEKVCPGS